MRETTWVIVWAALLGLAVACGAPETETGTGPDAPPVPTAAATVARLPRAVLPDGSAVTLDLARTSEEQSGGLMYRATLPADEGMLFLFPDPTYPRFWMKDTWVALDLVFLDAAGRVVQVDAEVPPCHDEPCPQYGPTEPSLAVLELAAGVAARSGVVPGAELRFENLSGYPRPPAAAAPSPATPAGSGS